MRFSGVESCSSGVHIDAGHHTTLAPVVSIANIVKEVKTGSDTVTQDLGPSVHSHERKRHSAQPSRCGWNDFASGRLLTSAALPLY